jgi:hypothetical protein
MKPRGSRTAWLGILAVSLALATAVQVGPAARPAAAEPEIECSKNNVDQKVRQDLNDVYIVWRCAYGRTSAGGG